MHATDRNLAAALAAAYTHDELDALHDQARRDRRRQELAAGLLLDLIRDLAAHIGREAARDWCDDHDATDIDPSEITDLVETATITVTWE